MFAYNALLQKQTQFSKQNKKFPHAYFREIYFYEVQLRSMGQIEMSWAYFMPIS